MGKLKQDTLSIMINNATYNDYLKRLKLVATSLFKWETSEDINFNSDYLELSLFDYGECVFIKDKALGYFVLRAEETGLVNVYNEPTLIRAVGENGYNKEYKAEDVILIKNNIMKLPTWETINLFAYRLYECQRTIDVNIMAQKTPVTLEGDEKSILTLKNIWEQWSGNMPVMFGRKNFSINDKINCLKTDAPFIADKVEQEKHEIWNECLTFLGINNANTDKKERLITDEVKSNNELIQYYLNCFYSPRKRACDEINKKFFEGREVVTIKVNDEIKNLLNEVESGIINVGNKSTEVKHE